ncbi:MAG: HAMP domain-containing protein [Cyanobacteria bacterium]|nr:HAMP domain-containing protein [Cyanobacteriota bacterium]
MVIKLFRKLGVQSKVLAMVLLASLLSLLLTGLLSYNIGSNVLTTAVTNQLVALRNSRAEALQDYFGFLRNHVLTMSEGFLVIDGLKDFRAAFPKLQNTTLSAEQQKKLVAYYTDVFIPKLKKNLEGEPALATYLPNTPADRYLTYHYTANNPRAPHLDELEDAGDGSEYSAVHRKYAKRFHRLTEVFGYRDIFLVDIDSGNVLFSVAKEADMGSNLKTGIYADTALGKTFDEIRKSRDPYFVYISDFEHYKASFGEPAFFIGSTVFDGDKFIGALIYQINPEQIDRVMTFNKKWEDKGLGKTGESFLVGQDFKLRSSFREFLENPDQYFQTLRANGVSQEKIDWIKRANSPVLIQEVKTEGAKRSLAGQTGEAEELDYRGKRVLKSYQPIRIGNYEWGLVAKIDKAEALQGVRRLRDALLLLGAILIPLLTLMSLALARTFIRPIQRLIGATKQIIAGDSSVQVKVDSADEFGELSSSFNSMAATLQQREEAIRSQLQENDRLLLNILPARTAERLKQGEQSITEQYPSVSVLYADLEGFQDLSSELEPDQAIVVLNELIGAFDDAAERCGVEKLRSTGSNYLAVCGLSVPRIDDEKRTVELALAMLQVVDRLSAKHGVRLSLDIGIHAGALAAGVVGSGKFYYDVWGETVTIARAIHISPKQNVIQVTEPVRRALDGLYSFEPLPPVEVKGEGVIPIWELTRLDPALVAVAVGAAA